MLIWMLRLEVRVAAEARVSFVVSGEAVVEVDLELPLRDEMEALKVEEVEVEAQDLLVGMLGEVVAVAEQETMRRSFGDWVEAAHVG